MLTSNSIGPWESIFSYFHECKEEKEGKEVKIIHGNSDSNL